MKKISYVLLFVLAWTGAAFAEEPAPNSADSLAKLNEQVAVLSARMKVLELQYQIADKQAGMAKLTGTSLSSDEASLPAVKSIEGVNGSMFAELVYSDGGKVSVEKGDSMQGGWLVESIGTRSVMLSNGKKKIRLALRMPKQSTSAASTSAQVR